MEFSVKFVLLVISVSVLSKDIPISTETNTNDLTFDSNPLKAHSVLLAVPVAIEGVTEATHDCVQTYEGALMAQDNIIIPDRPRKIYDESIEISGENRENLRAILLSPQVELPTPKREVYQVQLPENLKVVDLQPLRMRCSFYRFSDFRDNFDLMVILPGGPHPNCTMWSSYCNVVLAVANSNNPHCYTLYQAGMELPTDIMLKKYGELNIQEIKQVSQTCEPGAFTNLLLGKMHPGDYKQGEKVPETESTVEPEIDPGPSIVMEYVPREVSYSDHFTQFANPEEWLTPGHVIGLTILLFVLGFLFFKIGRTLRSLRLSAI